VREVIPEAGKRRGWSRFVHRKRSELIRKLGLTKGGEATKKLTGWCEGEGERDWLAFWELRITGGGGQARNSGQREKKKSSRKLTYFVLASA